MSMPTQNTVVRSCSVEECDRAHRARGYCATHYARFMETGDPGPAGRLHARPACSVEGCTRPHFGRGLCNTHYYRMRRNGRLDLEPRPARSKAPAEARRPKQACQVDGCEVTERGLTGYCNKHLTRIQRHGDPHRVIRHVDRNLPRGADNPNWTGAEASYSAVHQRLKRVRGAATEHICADCGSRGAQWSYDREDADERQSEDGPYSVNLEHYVSRCVPCHKRFDLKAVRS